MKFRKKPVVVEAMQFTEDSKNRVFHWVTGNKYPRTNAEGGPTLLIETLEGDATAQIGDWIIKGVKGEFYPCKPDIFALTYEPAEQIIAAHVPQPTKRSFDPLAKFPKCSTCGHYPWKLGTFPAYPDSCGFHACGCRNLVHFNEPSPPRASHVPQPTSVNCSTCKANEEAGVRCAECGRRIGPIVP